MQDLYTKIQSKDVSTMEDVLATALDRLDWMRETNPSYQISNDGKQVFLDIDLPEIEDMPNHTKKVIKTRQSIENKDKKPEEIQHDYIIHVHGILIRVAGTCFSLFPSIEKVLCSGYTQRINKQTGIMQDDYVLSIWFERLKWENTNPNQANPVNYVENFQFRREIKNGLFETIEPFSS